MQVFKGHLKEDKGKFSIVVSMRVGRKKKWAQWSTGLPVKGNKTYAQYLIGIVNQNIYEVHDEKDYKSLHQYIQKEIYRAILQEGFGHRLTPRCQRHLQNFVTQESLESSETHEIKEKKETFSDISTQEQESLDPNIPSFIIYCGVERPAFRLTPYTRFTDFLEVWIQHILPKEMRPTTYCKVRPILRYRDIPYFREQGTRLHELDEHILKDFYNRMEQGMKIEGKYYKPLSKSSIFQHHTYLKMALNFAVEHAILKNNPADHVSVKVKKSNRAKTTYTPEELIKLFQIVHGKSCEYPVLMAAYYGLRRAEILGLCWSDINFKKKFIRIQHSAHYVPVQGKFQTYITDVEKTNSSTRTLPLLKPIETMLRRIQEETQRNRFLFRDQYTLKYSDFVFVDHHGYLRKPETVSKALKNLVLQNELRYISLHNLRHTVGTLLSEENVNLEKIRDWLGHSDITTTTRYYLHSNYKTKIDTATVLETILPNYEKIFPSDEEPSSNDKTDSLKRIENALNV